MVNADPMAARVREFSRFVGRRRRRGGHPAWIWGQPRQVGAVVPFGPPNEGVDEDYMDDL